MRIPLVNLVGEECSDEISQLRRRLCEVSNSYASLQFPPHITLAHVKIAEGEIPALNDYIMELMKKVNPFRIKTNGIVTHSYQEKGKQKYTVRFDIEENPLLSDLRSSIMDTPLEQKKEFKDPHITLVFGDLTEDNFHRLENYLAGSESVRDFEYAFDNIAILRKKDDKWIVHTRFFPTHF
jgi:2'-5' RNA ligase